MTEEDQHENIYLWNRDSQVSIPIYRVPGVVGPLPDLLTLRRWHNSIAISS